MSSVIVPSYNQQQQQQQHNQQQQHVDDPLVQALAKYITTGPGSRNTTQSELREMVASSVAKPGGRAHLESLCAQTQHPECSVWENSASATGTIEFTKTGFSFSLRVPSLDVDYKADGSGFFRSYHGPLINGKIWYNSMDDLQPGPAEIQLHVDNLTLFVTFRRNQVYVASFNCGPIGFVLPPGILEGSGSFS